jgi:hypothetical protein
VLYAAQVMWCALAAMEDQCYMCLACVARLAEHYSPLVVETQEA